YIKLGVKLSEERKLRIRELEARREEEGGGILQDEKLQEINHNFTKGHLIRSGFNLVPKEQ
ncbi:Hypothetical protein FKW44_003394, partial [Caligus rogercresseyi]